MCFIFKQEIKHSDVHISDCKENNEAFASIKEKVLFFLLPLLLFYMDTIAII